MENEKKLFKKEKDNEVTTGGRASCQYEHSIIQFFFCNSSISTVESKITCTTTIT